MKTTLRIIAFFCLLWISPTLKATHIVGGEMNYTCLGNDQYEITLTIFRDCYNGNPNAWFDDPALIGIFNSDILIDSISIPLIINDTLNPVLSDDCLVVPPDVCVHTTTYTAIVNLPFQQDGYELRYQRCCRNETIENIVDPLDAGATYSTFISESALTECNSSAKFLEWPPIYICVNEPINFDQSAIDVDGDSIVYILCTPLLGATPDSPQPVPSDQTPPIPLTWLDPPYSLNNVLGGVPLEINSETGLLTGIPNTVGQFVVGICLEEYRDGELISTTRRDFQYNVGVCSEAISAFTAPEVQCDGFTVEFDNQSENADNYLWFFNDPLNPNATSEFSSPSYTYQDTGLYTITLIAEPGNACVDSFEAQVYLQYPSLFAEFDYEYEECSDSIIIAVTDLTYDTISTPVLWEWTVSDGQTSNEQNPNFVFNSSQDITIELLVTAENGCTNSIEQFFEANLIEVEFFTDFESICLGESVTLNPTGAATYFYDWSPAASLDDPSIPNPIATPTETTVYTATITDVSGNCQIIRQVTVFVPEPVTVEAPADITSCETEIELTAITNTGLEFSWANDADFDVIFSNEQTITVIPFGAETYYVMVVDSLGCEAFDEITVNGLGINLSIDSLAVICEGETAMLNVNNIDLVDELTYFWTPEDQIVSGQGTANPVVMPPSFGTYTYYLNSQNQFDCERIDSVTVGVIDTTAQDFYVDFLQCSDYSVNFTNVSSNAPYYIWNFGDPLDPSASSTDANPTHTYGNPGIYTVSLMINYDVDCPDTIIKEINLEMPQIFPDFDYEYEDCGESVTINFADLSVNNQSNITAWNWNFSEGNILASELQNPTIEISNSTTLIVDLEITSADGCVDLIQQSIEVELIEVELPDTLTICPGQLIQLYSGAPNGYDWVWSPNIGLDNPEDANTFANPTVSTTYTASITNIGIDTCQITREVVVIVHPEIDLEVPNDTIICEDEFLLFANSSNATNFTWSDGPLPAGFISNEPEVLVMPNRPSTYLIQVEDQFGCQKTDTIVVSSFTPAISVVENIFICGGEEIQISAINLIPSDELTFSWEPMSEILSGGTTSSPFVNPDVNTVYTVTATNQEGCTTTAAINVNVSATLPPLTISAEPDTVINGQSTQLLATQDGNYIYEWDEDASLDDVSIYNPIATPTESTIYSLTITDETGCTNQAEIFILVLDISCDDPFIFIPNAFTPNGDGENDELTVFGNVIDELYLAIYNRWGQKVFEANTPEEASWDGRFKGELLPPDVFGYYLEVQCFNGETYFKKGNITLIR